MSKPPRIVIPGLNRGAGIPPGYTLGRRRGTGKGPAELLDLAQMRGAGLATSAQVAQQVDALSTALSATTMGASPAVAFVTDDCDHDDGMPNPEMGLNQKADIKNVVAVVDDTANWGSPRFKRMLGTSPSGGFSIGDNAIQDTITIGRFDGDDIGFISLDAQGFTGGTFFGGTRNAITNRMVWSVYGLIAGVEFDHDIYVNSDKIYHEGNLSFGSGLTYSGGVLTASGGAGTAGPQGPIGFGMDGMDGEEGMPIPGAPGAAGAAGSSTLLIGFEIDGGGSAITTGFKGYSPRISAAHTITKVTVLSVDSTGPATTCSITVDVWATPYASYPPTSANKISASAPATLSSAIKSEDSTLSGWTTPVPADTIYGFNVASVSGAQKILVLIKASIP